MRIGLDVGSTTLKCIVLDHANRIIYQEYERHFSEITQKLADMLKRICLRFPNMKEAEFAISGSAGMGLASSCDMPFVQEVYAARTAVNKFLPGTDVVIELGGEDAKILFLSEDSLGAGGLEVRMNGSCAGGTGAFIDQMAMLLSLTPEEMNIFAKDYEKIYTIASRCGVFAKSDIQPILNQGAKKSDIAASIFAAVVNQTVAGLAQGRDIKGQVVYLGGPLTFLSELRESFNRILSIQGICPEDSLYYVAVGAALSKECQCFNMQQIVRKIEGYTSVASYQSCAPLFQNEEDYKAFQKRHALNAVKVNEEYSTLNEAYIGIDAGSTTVKAAVIDKEGRLIFSKYMSNSGNPILLIKNFLLELFEKHPMLRIISSAATGYGEELVKNAFGIDFGIVETVAHFMAAKQFRSDVDFIIDIGGQDIKCFKVHNGVIDNIFLNEACSSGCGSFLQTFAGAMGYSIETFAQKGILATQPVDLGSRCTVFMNSSVKQAQKDGASIENISAGLSISVVKNTIYKVIRAAKADDLGQNIVVQGGTFLNDAVLRAFEQEIGREVIRPNIAGLMGAYGAALYAKAHASGVSSILSKSQLKSFQHEVKVIVCKGCLNNCRLTVNTFDEGRKFIGGNRCEKPLRGQITSKRLNLYDYKRQLLKSYQPHPGRRGKIGIPMGLNMYELLPFWHTFFTDLKFEVIVSPESNSTLYASGQHTIPSDTVCFPAKLMHGHIEALLRLGVERIFYPCMTYNLDEHLGDNHYNCPVVAYYPEVIKANITALDKIDFIYDYIGLHRKKDFAKKIYQNLSEHFKDLSFLEVKQAAQRAYDAYEDYMQKVKAKGKSFIKEAMRQNQPIIILAGRPYHLDSEINHGIDQLICELGAAVVSEDAVSDEVHKFSTKVLNQWTYHSRLYAAAVYATRSAYSRINLVQLVSFGCGVDAITTDEVRELLEDHSKIYTQIKIDEITHLGAVKIRLRSLFAVLENRKEQTYEA